MRPRRNAPDRNRTSARGLGSRSIDARGVQLGPLSPLRPRSNAHRVRLSTPESAVVPACPGRRLVDGETSCEWSQRSDRSRRRCAARLQPGALLEYVSAASRWLPLPRGARCGPGPDRVQVHGRPRRAGATVRTVRVLTRLPRARGSFRSGLVMWDPQAGDPVPEHTTGRGIAVGG